MSDLDICNYTIVLTAEHVTFCLICLAWLESFAGLLRYASTTRFVQNRWTRDHYESDLTPFESGT